jgi:hypothetical protein
LQNGGIDMLLHKFPPKRLSRIDSDIFEHLVAKEEFLVLENLIHIDLAYFLNVLLILFNQVLFDLDFAPKYNKLVMDWWVAQLTIH